VLEVELNSNQPTNQQTLHKHLACTKNWQIASLVCCTKLKKKNNNENWRRVTNKQVKF